MDPLSAFLFSLLCSAAYDVIRTSLKSKFPEHISDKISEAFTEALKKWTPDEELRETEMKTLDEKILLLKEQIDKTTNPLDINEETQSLLDLFRVELMNDSIAYHFLAELRWDKNESDLAKLNQTTQEILSYIKPQKSQLYINFPFNHFITKITPNQYHIPRKIQSVQGNNEIKSNNDLISLIEKNVRTNIVVLASAGMGKTEELKQTAITLANRESKYPILISFSNFTADKDIVDYLPKTWINVPQEQLVLLLDGFDELIDNQINIIQRKLISFVENHPKIIIVVSCRTNFYHLAINGNPETLSGFNAYYLQQLTYADVVNHVTNKHDLDGQSFMNAVYHRQFDDLVYNPFFLQILIPDFKQNNAFSGNRTQLFQKFIKERLSWDKEHFATSFNLNDEESKALELLRKVSVAMEMLGSRNISIKDLRTLISDKPDFELIKRCTVFNKVEGFEEWKFEHNNFQEILCAEMLADLPFETVIELISFKGHNKIQPSWTNTVSFLISLLDENDTLFHPLVDWIICYDPEILVKVEKERIPQQIRNEIFINIFEYYKGLNIWINSNNFSYFDLANFGQSKETIKYLLNEAKNPKNTRRIRLNALSIIGSFSIRENQIRNDIKQKLLALIVAEKLNAEFINNVIFCLKYIGCIDKQTLNDLLDVLGERHSKYIRSAMYALINMSNYVDDYVDYYIDGIKIYINKNNSSDDREIDNIKEDAALFDGIFKLKTYTGISKFIDFYLLNYSLLENEFEFTNNYEQLIKNCIAIYETEKRIFNYAYSLLIIEIEYTSYYSQQPKTHLFFDKTNTKDKALIHTYSLLSKNSEKNYLYLTLICQIIDDINIVELIDLFKQQQISPQLMNDICYNLNFTNKVLSNKLKQVIYENTGSVIEFPITTDFDKIRKERAQRSFDLLFDIQLLKKECLNVFGDKVILFKDEILSYKRNQSSKYTNYIPICVTELLVTLKSDNKDVIYIETVLNWFESLDNITYFIINRIYFYLSDRNSDIIISNEQIEYINNWFNKTITEIDFTSISGSNLFGISCISFINKFGFECDEDILLDMLSFSNVGSNQLALGFIESKIAIEKIKSRIVKNIKDKSILNDHIYVKHAEFIFKNRIYEVYSNVFEDLIEIIFDKHDKFSIIDLFFKYNLNTDPIKDIFSRLDFECQILTLRWLVKNDDLEYSTTKLLNLHKEGLDEETEKTINNLLISCKNIDGLKFSINWIEKYKVSPFSQHEQRLVYFETLDSLPLFLRLLELGYDTEIKIGNILNGMLSIVLEGIYYLAIQSEQNFNEVCLKLKEFIEVNKGKLDEVEFLNATIERIKEKFFQTHSIKFTVKQIKQRLNSFAL
ncbi:MAG: hypothetical protein JZU53_17115 [Paludibacter sp.]|nr:hypothetical protein [Paludibacter sp.]